MVAPGNRLSQTKNHPLSCGWPLLIYPGAEGIAQLVRLLRRLRRAIRLRRPVAAFRHELVELRLVLGLPQPVKEIAEVALLILESAQRIGAVFIKGAIAAGPLRAPPIASGAHP